VAMEEEAEINYVYHPYLEKDFINVCGGFWLYSDGATNGPP